MAFVTHKYRKGGLNGEQEKTYEGTIEGSVHCALTNNQCSERAFYVERWFANTSEDV